MTTHKVMYFTAYPGGGLGTSVRMCGHFGVEGNTLRSKVESPINDSEICRMLSYVRVGLETVKMNNLKALYYLSVG